jgi:hypothetical protein
VIQVLLLPLGVFWLLKQLAEPLFRNGTAGAVGDLAAVHEEMGQDDKKI